MKIEMDERSTAVAIVLAVVIMLTVLGTVGIVRCSTITTTALEKGYVEVQCKGASGTMWTKPENGTNR